MSLSDENAWYRRQAEHHFKRARIQAARDLFSTWLAGRKADNLLPFEAVRAELDDQHPLYLGIRLVPIERIVGSVARYDDFTRQFLPLKDSLRERWIKVETVAMRRGWPPIDLFQVGEVYFVSDGNHRVAVARQMSYDTIEARVWRFPANIDIDPEASLDELLNRLGERNFMECTNLDARFPEHHIRFTTPGRYRELLAQIKHMQRLLSVIDEREVPYEEAVDDWYEMVYLPSTQMICDSGILDSFPGRTEADLFVWLSVHREILQQQYGPYENIAELLGRVAETWQPQGIARLYHKVMHFLGREVSPVPLPELRQDDASS
jgi:hypothetical protein